MAKFTYLQPPIHHFSILRLKHAKHSKNDAAHGRCCATVQSLPETKRAAATASYTIARITGLFWVCCRPCVVTLRFMPKMALLLKMTWQPTVRCPPHCSLPPAAGQRKDQAVRLRPSFLAAAPRSVRSDDAMIPGCPTRSAATSLQLLAVQTRNKPVIHTIVQVADVVVCFVSGLQFVTTLERSSEQQHHLLRCRFAERD